MTILVQKKGAPIFPNIFFYYIITKKIVSLESVFYKNTKDSGNSHKNE